ncbi:NADase-type glycan-binding domain-containing protein [Leptospira sp. 'Mane']|uniref:NADase-type glycan-binding domain-containing protein n=1 Tax=Leptospira sp. 'Mane' TaxID=3387407 RepID=UPI00398AF2EA
MFKFQNSLAILIFATLIACGPKTEKALTYQSSSSIGQVNPEQPWRYSPEFVLDGKATTGFCADPKQTDSGFTLFLENSSEFSAIQVINGYAKSANDAVQNAQAKKIKLTSLVVSFPEGKTKIHSQESVTVELKPVSFAGTTANAEAVDLGQKLKGNWIRIEFLDFHKGTKYKDICISELKVGELKDSKFTSYPITNEGKVKTVIAGYEEGSRHYWAFRKLITANEAGSINFYDQDLVLPVYFKADNTFSFSEMFGGDPNAGGFQAAIQGRYSVFSAGEQGVELTLNYFDAGGVERNDSWIFKRAIADDEDFETFKTKLGTKFSEVFDSKSFYLLFLKEKESNRSFYNYEIPLK